MDILDFVGQTLDSKYHIERELGRGGMGTVYLANHLGTERPVAIKIISPQFMQRAEFVERFRREARAAGRLRHPNVVDVTDFGFADTSSGQVAYLVMEYLDGCTLGEILDEEKNLPVGWTLDILEQVCSAVQEAHQQGIIHRDLKPDNIWLEPNQRGGYTVKVLDFGIAKLEEHDSTGSGDMPEEFRRSTHTQVGARTTFAGDPGNDTFVGDTNGTHVSSDGPTLTVNSEGRTLIAEAGTVLLAPAVDEGETRIYDGEEADFSDQDTVGTRVSNSSNRVSGTDGKTVGHSLYESRSSAELTRVGAVLGTPLYMSPEQCRGEHLDTRSDIYSMGVIAYQMLSGSLPFEGDYKEVMESHKNVEPKMLPAKKIRKKLKRTIHDALSKSPDDRPQSAEAFASELRSRSEGIFGLLRRALVIYSEHLPKFLLLTAFFSIPSIVLTLLLVTFSFLKVSESIDNTTSNFIIGFLGIMLTVVSGFCTYLNIGTITWIVTQYIAVPLRPVRIRPALVEARKKWKAFAGTGVLSTVLIFAIGVLTCGLGFLVLSVLWNLAAPVVMMENLKGRAALRRSKLLVKRSVMTAVAAVLIMFLIPAIVAGSISFVVNVAAKAFDPRPPKPPSEKNMSDRVADQIVQSQTDPEAKSAAETEAMPAANTGTPTEPKPTESPVTTKEGKKDDGEFSINLGRNRAFQLGGGSGRRDMRTRVKDTVLESLIQILWMPMQILVLSFSAIIVALLYMKTRLAGGESMNDLIERFEDDGRPKKKWQERVRERLIQSGRISSNPSK